MSIPKLGVNIDHVATLRQVRRALVPNVTEAAIEAVKGGADSITIHLREDRRHIQDADVSSVLKAVKCPVNLEMALHPDIVKIALREVPHKVCIVPEKRQELTTEGGLNALKAKAQLKKILPAFYKKKIEVSLFIDADEDQIKTAAELCVPAIEIHTGTYANVTGTARKKELARIIAGAKLAHSLGIKVHAGHGLDYENVAAIARVPFMAELNIGHSIVARSVFVGLRTAVAEMTKAIRASF